MGGLAVVVLAGMADRPVPVAARLMTRVPSRPGEDRVMGSSGREVRPGAGLFVGHPEMEPGRPSGATVKTAVSLSVDPRPAVSMTGVLITGARMIVASPTVACPIADREAVASMMVMRATAGLVAPRRPTVDLTISPAVKRVPMAPNPLPMTCSGGVMPPRLLSKRDARFIASGAPVRCGVLPNSCSFFGMPKPLEFL